MMTQGLVALTVEEERQEVAVVKMRRIKFAFFQQTLDGQKIPYWHVNYVGPNEFGTTLSMEGLKHWGVL